MTSTASEQIETTGIPFAAFEMKFATEMVQTIQKHSETMTKEITSVDIQGQYGPGAVVALARNKGRFVMVLPGVDGTAKVPKHMEYAITRIVVGSNVKKAKKAKAVKQPRQSDSTEDGGDGEVKATRRKRRPASGLAANPAHTNDGDGEVPVEGDLDDDLQGILALINLGKPKRKRTARNDAPVVQSELVDVDDDDDDDVNLQYPPSMVGTGVVGRRTSPHRTVFASSAPSSSDEENVPIVGRLSQPETKKKKAKRGGRRVEEDHTQQPQPKPPQQYQPKESPQRTTFSSSSSSSSSYTYSAWTQEEAK